VELLRTLLDRAGAPGFKGRADGGRLASPRGGGKQPYSSIAALRRVLREEPGGERWIQTLPRRGYRFVGPVIKNDAPAKNPFVNAVNETGNNLPVQLTSFIGRATDLGEIKGLLASNRLVTIAGIGGSSDSVARRTRPRIDRPSHGSIIPNA
jgi:hypothetical protein